MIASITHSPVFWFLLSMVVTAIMAGIVYYGLRPKEDDYLDVTDKPVMPSRRTFIDSVSPAPPGRKFSPED